MPATLTEGVQEMDAAQASVRNLFETDTHQRAGRRAGHPDYERRLVEAWQFVRAVESGRRPMWQLQEAMSTSDFPELFGDVLQRQMLDRYAEWPVTWPNYCRRSTVPDFRDAKRFAVDGAEGELSEVGEREEYPEESLSEAKDTISVAKYGRRLDLAWEAIVNNDLDGFRNIPDRLARGARRTEERKATQLFVGTSGPDGTLYSDTHGPDSDESNKIDGNPTLDVSGLQTGFTTLSQMTDEDGEPIVIEAVELVVPPALEVDAQNMLNALHIDAGSAGGTSNQTVRAANWMAGRVRLSVNPYIPIIADSNGDTSWFLFANPSSGRAALEVAFLQGNEQPSLWRKMPNATPVGGGGEPMEDFATDSVAWRVRHVLGTAQLINTGGWRATVASDGTGS